MHKGCHNNAAPPVFFRPGNKKLNPYQALGFLRTSYRSVRRSVIVRTDP